MATSLTSLWLLNWTRRRSFSLGGTAGAPALAGGLVPAMDSSLSCEMLISLKPSSPDMMDIWRVLSGKTRYEVGKLLFSYGILWCVNDETDMYSRTDSETPRSLGKGFLFDATTGSMDICLTSNDEIVEDKVNNVIQHQQQQQAGD